jgi:hypothetical protein
MKLIFKTILTFSCLLFSTQGILAENPLEKLVSSVHKYPIGGDVKKVTSGCNFLIEESGARTTKIKDGTIVVIPKKPVAETLDGGAKIIEKLTLDTKSGSSNPSRFSIFPTNNNKILYSGGETVYPKGTFLGSQEPMKQKKICCESFIKGECKLPKGLSVSESTVDYELNSKNAKFSKPNEPVLENPPPEVSLAEALKKELDNKAEEYKGLPIDEKEANINYRDSLLKGMELLNDNSPNLEISKLSNNGPIPKTENYSMLGNLNKNVIDKTNQPIRTFLNELHFGLGRLFFGNW